MRIPLIDYVGCFVFAWLIGGGLWLARLISHRPPGAAERVVCWAG